MECCGVRFFCQMLQYIIYPEAMAVMLACLRGLYFQYFTSLFCIVMHRLVTVTIYVVSSIFPFLKKKKQITAFSNWVFKVHLLFFFLLDLATS